MFDSEVVLLGEIRCLSLLGTQGLMEACWLSLHVIGHDIILKLWVFILVGAEGKVEESMELMKEVEDLKVKKKMAEVCL